MMCALGNPTISLDLEEYALSPLRYDKNPRFDGVKSVFPWVFLCFIESDEFI